MGDWTGIGRSTAEVYRSTAERELHGSSPSYEALCLAVAANPRVLDLLGSLPTEKTQPNLLLAAVRYLGGPVDDPAAFLRFVVSSWDALAETMMTHRTQTNEPGRCATLLPVLSALPQPLALIEVGASAGLCLVPERYSYRYSTPGGEHRVGVSSIELSCAVSGPAPVPDRLPDVTWRAGIDLFPLRADRADDRRWLSSLVWPEHRERAARLHTALDLVAVKPPRMVAGDLLVELPALASEAPADATLVVFHTATLAYLAPERRADFTDLMGTLRRERGAHWISNEADGVIEVNGFDPAPRDRFVLAKNQRALALTGPHGQSLEWLSDPGADERAG